MRDITIRLPTGLRIAAMTWGSRKSKTKILALHGWMDNCGTWFKMAPGLANAGAYVVAIDFVGHGQSDHLPQNAEYMAVMYAMTVVQVIEALGWTSCHLMGHSMGAGVSTIVAGTLPAVIKTLTLIDSVGPFTTDMMPLTAPLMLEKAVAERKNLFKRVPQVYTNFQDVVNKFRKNNPSQALHTSTAIAKRGTVQVEGGYSFCHDYRLVGNSLMRFREEDIIHFLERISCPVMLILAESTVNRLKNVKKRDEAKEQEQRDAGKEVKPKISMLDLFKRRVDTITNITVKIVKGGHHVHSDNADLCLPYVLQMTKKKASKL